MQFCLEMQIPWVEFIVQQHVKDEFYWGYFPKKNFKDAFSSIYGLNGQSIKSIWRGLCNLDQSAENGFPRKTNDPYFSNNMQNYEFIK